MSPWLSFFIGLTAGVFLGGVGLIVYTVIGAWGDY